MDAQARTMIGYGLLCAGLVLIAAGTYNVYTVLTGAARAPAVLAMESVSIKVSGAGGAVSDIVLLSGEVATQMVNLVLWYILMFFLVSAGGKVAGLGIGLVKDTVIKVSGKV